jgi:hypothetical protein
MKKLILSSALLIASGFYAAAQNNQISNTPTLSQSTEPAVAAEEAKKPEKPVVLDANAPKKSCCSHDQKSSSAKSVAHKHGKKSCKAKCCAKKES